MKGNFSMHSNYEVFCSNLTLFVLRYIGGESGSADTVRDPRGFAVKFYTEDGNWDLVGNNTPIFFIRDPILVGDSHNYNLELMCRVIAIITKVCGLLCKKPTTSWKKIVLGLSSKCDIFLVTL